MSITGVAAGHPATVEAGMSILDAGGNAADAAVAAAMTSCAAETIMTGLGGGGFATYYDAARQQVSCLDFFVATPGITGAVSATEPTPIAVSFGSIPLEFAIGAASVAVPGVPAGCAELHGRFGRLPWHEVLQPAIGCARRGVDLLPRHAEALATMYPALLPGEGARAYAPSGKLLTAGQRLRHPGLADTLGLLAAEGAAPFYGGDLARDISQAVSTAGGALRLADLGRYRVRWLPTQTTTFAGCQVWGRRDLAGTIDTLGRLDSVTALEPGKRAGAVAEALAGPSDRQPGDTTNLSVVDSDGNACVVTTTLGMGSGIWATGSGVHLNSMLGEGELLVAGAVAGQRMASMMCPLVLIRPDSGRVEVAIGSAGASRIRSALVHCLMYALADGHELESALAKPRWHIADSTVHFESGLDPAVTAALGRADYRMSEWTSGLHYFGGASAVGVRGAAGDPRRNGDARIAPD